MLWCVCMCRLCIHNTQGGFQLEVRAEHVPQGREGGVELVAQFVIEALVEVEMMGSWEGEGGEGDVDERGFTLHTERSRGQQSLGIAYRLTCSEHYYGTDCSVQCEPQDGDEGHYSCDGQGSVLCLQGYTDTATRCTQCLPTLDCSEWDAIVVQFSG